MVKVLSEAQINKTSIKLEQINNGFKVSYGSYSSEFDDIDKAITFYCDTVKLYVTFENHTIPMRYSEVIVS